MDAKDIDDLAIGVGVGPDGSAFVGISPEPGSLAPGPHQELYGSPHLCAMPSEHPKPLIPVHPPTATTHNQDSLQSFAASVPRLYRQRLIERLSQNGPYPTSKEERDKLRSKRVSSKKPPVCPTLTVPEKLPPVGDWLEYADQDLQLERPEPQQDQLFNRSISWEPGCGHLSSDYDLLASMAEDDETEKENSLELIEEAQKDAGNVEYQLAPNGPEDELVSVREYTPSIFMTENQTAEESSVSGHDHWDQTLEHLQEPQVPVKGLIEEQYPTPSEFDSEGYLELPGGLPMWHDIPEEQATGISSTSNDTISTLRLSEVNPTQTEDWIAGNMLETFPFESTSARFDMLSSGAPLPELPENPEFLEEFPGLPQNSEFFGLPGLPENPDFFGLPGLPENPDFLELPALPENPNFLEWSDFPEFAEFPELAELPENAESLGLHDFPDFTNYPELADLPKLPELTELPVSDAGDSADLAPTDFEVRLVSGQLTEEDYARLYTGE